MKRLLREAFLREGDRLPMGSDVVVIARPGCRDLGEREGLDGLRRALAELISKVPGAVHADSETVPGERVPGAEVETR